jgi:cytochrome c oxidase assembly factor CtaG
MGVGLLAPADFFLKARLAPIDTAALAVFGGWYVWALMRRRAAGRTWPPVRTACFVVGCVVFLLGTDSGLSAFTRTNFSTFAAQYSMVGLVAPLLFAFSAPLTLAGGWEWLHRRSARWVAGPVTTWVLFDASVLVFGFSGLLPDALGGGWAAQAILLALAVVGTIFCWPVVDIDPVPRRIGFWPRILYLLLSFPIFAILGMGLESQTTRVNPAMTLGSLHLGAAVIWVAGEGIGLLGAIWVFAQWLRQDERRARSHDLANEEAAARQLALWRASRDAAARAAGAASPQ